MNPSVARIVAKDCADALFSQYDPTANGKRLGTYAGKSLARGKEIACRLAKGAFLIFLTNRSFSDIMKMSGFVPHSQKKESRGIEKSDPFLCQNRQIHSFTLA